MSNLTAILKFRFGIEIAPETFKIEVNINVNVIVEVITARISIGNGGFLYDRKKSNAKKEYGR